MSNEKKFSWKRLLKIAICFIICILFISYLLSSVKKYRSTRATNEDLISANQEEISSVDEEIDYYNSQITKPKEELIEEAAREKGYVYENETKYSNCTPGA